MICSIMFSIDDGWCFIITFSSSLFLWFITRARVSIKSFYCAPWWEECDEIELFARPCHINKWRNSWHLIDRRERIVMMNRHCHNYLRSVRSVIEPIVHRCGEDKFVFLSIELFGRTAMGRRASVRNPANDGVSKQFFCCLFCRRQCYLFIDFFRLSITAFPYCALSCVFNVAHMPLTPLQKSSSSSFFFFFLSSYPHGRRTR